MNSKAMKPKDKRFLISLLVTISEQSKQQDFIAELDPFFICYSFLLNDTSKPQNSCAPKTPQFSTPQGNTDIDARYPAPMYGRLYHYAGNNPVRYTDPTGMWHLDPLNGQWVADKGDTLYGKFGKDWQKKTGYTGDPTKLQIGEHVGPTRWTSGNGTGADINSFPDKWERNAYDIRDEEGNILLSNLHEYAENFSHPTGDNGMDVFVVAGHGNEVEGKTALLSKDKNADIGPKALAGAILNHPNYTEGQEVLLVSCFIGRGICN